MILTLIEFDPNDISKMNKKRNNELRDGILYEK